MISLSIGVSKNRGMMNNYRVTVIANIYVSAGSEDESISKVESMDKDTLEYHYFSELDEDIDIPVDDCE